MPENVVWVIQVFGETEFITILFFQDKRRGDLQAVKIIPELTQMTGFTDQQRQNYKMMNVSLI